MRPTEKAMASMELGGKLAMLSWSAFNEDYGVGRAALTEKLRIIGLDIVLPESAKEFEAVVMDTVGTIYSHLKELRSQLSGDCYALPMFIVNFMSFRAIAHGALGIDIEMETTFLRAALDDLGIDATDEGVMALLRNELQWIETLKDNEEAQVRSRDVVHAWSRIMPRIFDLWGEAERRRADDLPSIGLDYVPRYSCFISYSHADEEFAREIYDRLRFRGVKVWYAPEAMKPGRKLQDQIAAALGSHDRLLLVLSEASLTSNWVEHELYRARKRELVDKVRMLFPIRLVTMERLKQWEAFDADTGRDLAREVREYFIPDFSGWRDAAVLDGAIAQLLDGLRREDEATGAPAATANQAPLETKG